MLLPFIAKLACFKTEPPDLPFIVRLLLIAILSKKGIFIENDPDFDVAQTLECGQCFNFTPTDMGYKIKAFSKVLNISIEKEGFILHTGEEEFKNTWYNYFDLDTDYGHIKEEICKNDAIMQEAVAFAPGIRILEQDRWECLLSFIISQNNSLSI